MITRVFRSKNSRSTYSILFACCLTLSACSSLPDAAPTPYKAAKSASEYGFSSVQLAEGQYRVMFKATQATDAASVQEYTLYRAAEIAKAQGYSWLTITKTDVDRKTTLGKSAVKAEASKQAVSPILTDQQCTMSGCSQVGQPFPASATGMTVETSMMRDVYYSVVVRMSQHEEDASFSVAEILQHPPGNQ